MDNFTYYNPVQIYFGEKQVKALPKLVSNYENILIIYGMGSIKKNGILEQVKTELKDKNTFEFSGIGANPRLEQISDVFDLIKKNQIDFLLAIGGGSVIDATKFISVATYHPDDPWKILSERQKIQKNIDFGCVLTLPATGSESNAFSVISKGDEKLGFGGDPRLYAKFAILDPTYTYSLPQKQLANGIVDAYVHVLEQYLTVHNEAHIQDMYALSVLTVLQDIADDVLNKQEYHSRANFMWAANQALNGLLGMGQVHDWSTHMIGHELTALYNIDHARTLAIILPAVMEIQKDKKQNKLIEYGMAIFNEKDIDLIIKKTKQFFDSLNVPTTLKAYNIDRSDFQKIAKQVRTHIPVNIGEHKDIDEAKIIQILERAYE